MTVWVVQQYGNVLFVCRDEETARREVEDLVARSWPLSTRTWQEDGLRIWGYAFIHVTAFVLR